MRGSRTTRERDPLGSRRAADEACRNARRARLRRWPTYTPTRIRLAVYTDSEDVGGAERSAATLLAELPPRFDVVVLATSGRVADAIGGRRGGAQTIVLPPIRGKRDVGAIVTHARAILGLRPDVLQFNLITPWSCRYGILAALLVRGVRLVAVEHLPGPTESSVQRVFKRLSSRRLAAHVAVGERTAREVERLADLAPGSIRTIYNGVPDVALRPVPRPAAGPIVGSIGRFDHQKGFDLLVRALAEVQGATAVLVGDGRERAALESLAREVGVHERLVLTGWQERPRDQLGSFDVFVLPSRFEGFPLAVVEAMLAGLPVVAADVGSVAEAVVDEETGLLVPSGDVDALVGALRRLVEDPELRVRLGRAGRARALARFLPATTAAGFERLYDEIAR